MSLDINHPTSDGLSFEDVLEILEQEIDSQMYDNDEDLAELDFNED